MQRCGLSGPCLRTSIPWPGPTVVSVHKALQCHNKAAIGSNASKHPQILVTWQPEGKRAAAPSRIFFQATCSQRVPPAILTWCAGKLVRRCANVVKRVVIRTILLRESRVWARGPCFEMLVVRAARRVASLHCSADGGTSASRCQDVAVAPSS